MLQSKVTFTNIYILILIIYLHRTVLIKERSGHVYTKATYTYTYIRGTHKLNTFNPLHVAVNVRTRAKGI